MSSMGVLEKSSLVVIPCTSLENDQILTVESRDELATVKGVIGWQFKPV